jgi:hypothetical protein
MVQQVIGPPGQPQRSPHVLAVARFRLNEPANSSTSARVVRAVLKIDRVIVSFLLSQKMRFVIMQV